jgi:hypothetical protein
MRFFAVSFLQIGPRIAVSASTVAPTTVAISVDAALVATYVPVTAVAGFTDPGTAGCFGLLKAIGEKVAW